MSATTKGFPILNSRRRAHNLVPHLPRDSCRLFPTHAYVIGKVMGYCPEDRQPQSFLCIPGVFLIQCHLMPTHSNINFTTTTAASATTITTILSAFLEAMPPPRYPTP